MENEPCSCQYYLKWLVDFPWLCYFTRWFQVFFAFAPADVLPFLRTSLKQVVQAPPRWVKICWFLRVPESQKPFDQQVLSDNILVKNTTRFISRWWFQIQYCFFSFLLGEDSHFDEHIFQIGWNHQPDIHVKSRLVVHRNKRRKVDKVESSEVQRAWAKMLLLINEKTQASPGCYDVFI